MKVFYFLMTFFVMFWVFSCSEPDNITNVTNVLVDSYCEPSCDLQLEVCVGNDKESVKCELRVGLCRVDDDCSNGKKCFDNQCEFEQVETVECESDTDCFENEVCDLSKHKCRVVNCKVDTDCRSDEICNLESSKCEELEGWGEVPEEVNHPTTDAEKAEMETNFKSIIQKLDIIQGEIAETVILETKAKQIMEKFKESDKVIATEYKSKTLFIYPKFGEPLVILLDSNSRNKEVDETKKTEKKSSNFSINYISPTTGNKKALIIAPFQSDFGDDLCSIKLTIEEKGFLVDAYVDMDLPECGITKTTFDLSMLPVFTQNLNKYDFLYINTHGGSGGFITGIPYSEADYHSMILSEDYGIRVYYTHDDRSWFGVNTDFFNHYYKDDEFKNTYVHIDACHSGESTEFTNSFLDNGASIYVGYHSSIYPKQTTEFTIPFLKNLLNYGVNTDTAKYNGENPITTIWTTSAFDIITALIFKSQEVKDDPEGFILLPDLCKDACSGKPCKINNNIPVCTCGDGFSQNDNLECIPSCEGIDCQGNGECVLFNGLVPVCDCFDGYIRFGETTCLESTCENNCGEHGHCVDGIQCKCQDGYAFNNDTKLCEASCVDIDCGLGTCEVIEDRATCSCPDGYYSTYDYYCLEGVSPCIDIDCGENKTCVTSSSGNGYACICNDGYKYIDGECVLDNGDTCSNKICESNATCNEQTGACECNIGFTLSNGVCIFNAPVEDCGADGMCLIPADSFMMGCNAVIDTECNTSEKPDHRVTLTNSFKMDKYEVTVAQFRACINANACSSDNYKTYSSVNYPRANLYRLGDSHDNHPMNYVSWHGAVEYCQWAGKRLPTEAEWEYASRGRNSTKYPWGNDEPTCEHAVYSGCNNGETSVIGSKPLGKSPFGLYDMSGNVLEWTNDWYAVYDSNGAPITNPTGAETGSTRVIRGGAWVNSSFYLRSSNRSSFNPTNMSSYIGFRCAKSQ